MIDFLLISTRSTKRGVIEIYPKFIIKKSSDLMIRGGDFYAIWIEERGLWSTEEDDAIQLIDRELDRYAEENRQKFDSNIKVLHMWDAETGMVDSWHKYCQKQMRDSFHMLDEKLTFSNNKTNKKDYASKRLPYPLEAGDISSYDKLISTLYTPDERHKIEWAIGSIVSGDSKKIQKFIVLYGAPGSGKGTILNIIQALFEGYYSVFDAKALGSSSNSFALESFKNNPLIAIQHDGDLSRIEDNTRLNSLVSHELMTVNEKFKSAYANNFKCFLFMGTNKPVKITDAKSGLIRRLIDVSPSGNTLSSREYNTAVKHVEFELGGIAKHCLDIFMEDPTKYDQYIPMSMLGASNDFYNFVIDSYHIFKNEDGTTLKASWEMYKTYCDEAKVSFPFSQRIFKEELKNYFSEYKERFNLDDGSRVRSYYIGFLTEKFEQSEGVESNEEKSKTVENKQPEGSPFLDAVPGETPFDVACASCIAQYGGEDEKPIDYWDNITSTLSKLDTSKLHYVRVPENHIVIDFDLTDESGKKSFEKNFKEAMKWPPTYAELSKGGAGIHLHYIYTGDPSKLSRVYDDHIEVKVFTGKSSLRRKLSKCNNLPIATISSGLPLKGEKEMVNFEIVKSENGIRTLIKRNLNKEIHPGTKPSIDFITKILEDAYKHGLKYDVSDMHNSILSFASGSTNQADYCIKAVSKMKFKSDTPSDSLPNEEAPIVFYDVEVFPNLFICNWKIQGKGKPVIRMINPTPSQIEEILRFRLVGYNCRRYDNHIMYARLMGYTNEQLYNLSQRIINGDSNCFFGAAYNLSYADIYDFSSKKQSLKKFEIELGLKHHELGLPWDKPVPEELWPKVAEYCDDDVLATEATWDALKADFIARQILADLAGMTVNDTTNTLTARIIFGNDRNPQSQFNYRDMGEIEELPFEMTEEDYTMFDGNKPIFPGYEFSGGKSTYRGEEVSEGGNVYSEPGMYVDTPVLDITSMHPHSIIAENLFGDVYTKRFKDLVDARIAVKHEDWVRASKMLDGKLVKFIKMIQDGLITSMDLANALKIAINSVYGLTSAKFNNPFRDRRNVDNIVAKRGALFMVNLRHAVQEKGFTVAHIKTDSIKIPNATPEIIDFVMDYGKKYGYSFEHESTYDRMCLVNDAVYIAKYASKEKCLNLHGYIPSDNKKHSNEWTATGTQFAVPYVFKKLFSKEDIEFEDLCETKSVSSALYLDLNEELERLDPLNQHNYRFVGKVGQFCPMKPGTGGGLLLRETVSKTGETGYASATGAKGYRWMESDMVKVLGKEDGIDRAYYDQLVDDAVKTISKYGDFEWFAAS